MYQAQSQQYQPPHGSYLELWVQDRNDFTRHVPCKAVDFDSHLFQEGVLGWTYLASSKTTRDRFLLPEQAYKTDCHECIHTDDEYEIRILIDWMLSPELTEYDKRLLKEKLEKETEKYYAGKQTVH